MARSEVALERARPRSHQGIGDLPVSRILIALSVAAVGAVVAYFGIMWFHDAKLFTGQSKTSLQLWAALVAAFACYGLLMASATSTYSWNLIQRFKDGPTGKQWFAVGGLTALILLLLFLVGHNLPAGTRGSHPFSPFSGQIIGLTAFGIAAALPGLLGLLLIREFALDERQWADTDNGTFIEQVAMLRRCARRFLGALGLFLTILVVMTAARRQSILSLHLKQHVAYSPESVILYGLMFVALLAAFYAPAMNGIEKRCEHLLSTIAAPAIDADDLSSKLQRRQDLATWLGMDQSLGASFQNGVIIFAPLLSALFGIALQGRAG